MTTAKKVAVDFQEIIQADRQRRKNEDLAQQIFGKGRRASAPGAGIGPRKPGTGPSLASRIGVTKQRSSSGTRAPTLGKGKRPGPPTGNVNADWTHDLFNGDSSASGQGAQRNSGPKATRVPKEARLYSAINGTASSTNNQFNIVGTSKTATGFSIRGLAGPCVVIAENFAPGTSAEDIESAMSQYGGPIIKCKLLPSNTMVIAEIIFDTREGADRVIEQFNNQTADGLVLRLYHKAATAPISSATPTGPRADLIKNDRSTDSRSARYSTSDRYEPRSSSRDRQYDREDVVDGSYGFEDKMDTEDSGDRNYARGRGRGGLYSDNMVSSRGDRSDRGDRRWGRGDSDRGRGNGGRDRGRGFR